MLIPDINEHESIEICICLHWTNNITFIYLETSKLTSYVVLSERKKKRCQNVAVVSRPSLSSKQ